MRSIHPQACLRGECRRPVPWCARGQRTTLLGLVELGAAAAGRCCAQQLSFRLTGHSAPNCLSVPFGLCRCPLARAPACKALRFPPACACARVATGQAASSEPAAMLQEVEVFASAGLDSRRISAGRDWPTDCNHCNGHDRGSTARLRQRVPKRTRVGGLGRHEPTRGGYGRPLRWVPVRIPLLVPPIPTHLRNHICTRAHAHTRPSGWRGLGAGAGACGGTRMPSQIISY